MPKVVILGAGLTGLSMAYFLEKSGFYDYQIIEKSDQPGGLLKTHKENGFVFDHTGHFLHINNAIFENFLDEIYGLTNMNMLNRKSFIYSNNIHTPYPFQKNLHGLPTKIIIDCITGFIERKNRIKNPKNFHEWVAKHFGLGLGKHFFFPYNSKLLNIKPKDLMPSWTSRFVPKIELKDLLECSLEPKEYSLDGYNSSFFYPKNGGIEQLIRNIVSKLSQKIKINSMASLIDQNKKQIHLQTGEKINYQMLFSTIPLPNLLKSLSDQTINNFETISNKLSCNQVLNFNIGINRPDLSEKHWIYFPEKKFKFYRVGFWHNFADSMVPRGHSSFYGEVSFRPETNKKTCKDKLLNQSIKQTLQFFKINKPEISIQKTLFLEHAYVVYDRWREDNLKKIHKTLATQDLHSIGRFGEWKYSSMQEAVLDGLENSKLALKKCLPNKKRINILEV